jgi:energy-coupling factor transporter transmembrane protein EcfT
MKVVEGMVTKLDLGVAGRLTLFIWSLGMVMVVPFSTLIFAGVLCLLVQMIIYPAALRRLLHPRWLILLALLFVPQMLWLGEIDGQILGVPISLEGVRIGFITTLRAVVILLAVEGLSQSVSIPEIAGLLERTGLRGLGFSVGVAVNLLPALQQSARNAWYSMRMRGGLRRNCWRGVQLLTVTIISNALRRAEEIALAAEARAFSPEKPRRQPLRQGRYDSVVLFVALLTWSTFLLAGLVL